MSETTPCIRCGAVLTRAHHGDDNNQPNDGLMCSTRGNYGSTVFDPENGEFLLFIVCDECMVVAGAEGRVLVGQRERPVMVDDGRCKSQWGSVRDIDRALLPWTRDFPRNDECMTLDLEGLAEFVDDWRFSWHARDRDGLLRMIESAAAPPEGTPDV